MTLSVSEDDGLAVGQCKRLAKRRASTRASAFVFVPFSTASLEARATGSKELCELVELAESTIHLLLNSRAKAVCPAVLVMSPDATNSRLAARHRLEGYAAALQAEQQLPIELHCAAHERLGKIGSGLGYTPESVAAGVHAMLMRAGVGAGAVDGRGLVVHFHVCRCADVAYDGGCFAEQTFLGRFHTTLKQLGGYTNVRVVGYSGLYMNLPSRKGAVVTRAGKTLPAEKVRYTVAGDGAVTPPALLAGQALMPWRETGYHTDKVA